MRAERPDAATTPPLPVPTRRLRLRHPARASTLPLGALANVLIGALLGALLSGCRGAETPVYTTQFVAFDAAVDLSIVGKLKADAQAASAEVEQDFLFLDYATNTWKPGPMARVNALLPKGEPFAAPPSLLPLLQQSQALALRTRNLFNPAIGQLLQLWGFQAAEPECRPPPSASAIESLVTQAPTMADLYLDGIMLQSDNPAVLLDFDGIVVGYAMDLAMDNLRQRDIHHAMLNRSGDVRAMGDRAGRPWRVPVRRGSSTGVLGIIDVVGDMAVFTSSMHERNFIHDGQVFHDVIDPRSGRPATGLQAVTVMVAGSAAVADVAADALMVAGLEGWRDVAARLDLRYVLLIDDAGTMHMTPPMAERLELLDDGADVAILQPEAPSDRGGADD
ncbi:FAD:protein FMN transferase [uncultured Thiohalocapsa sp.]|uniref:FAD:protein FMN transferase n=1 Tax=uncultured Thiohalocapsa sp. TaxID=768990 RepID=UPI0025DB5254|nr:FAD:protein FMN transferase [uncultured Thiohalocapsa sp.]